MTKIPWILFAVSIAASLYLAVKLLDAGIMLDNSRSEAKRLNERSERSLEIIELAWVGKSSAEVVELSKRFEKEGVIVGMEGDAFEIGDLIFETKDGVVTKVRHID